VTATGTTGNIGIQASIVQSAGLDRHYRIDVPFNATGEGIWKRLVPYDRTEKFVNQNSWALELNTVDKISTLRLVRTAAGTPPSSTVLKCKIIARPNVGESVSIQDNATTETAVSL
jgi:hypothetical protein